MLARLQQLLTLGLCASAVMWILIGLWAGWPVLGALLAVTTVTWPFALIALECLLNPWLNRHDTAFPRSARQLWHAFWQECRIGTQVFNWRQPFRSQSIPDNPNPPGAQGQLGVVLVHGYVCNRGLWLPWMQRWRAVDIPYIAVNLEPVFGSIDDYAPLIDEAARRLHATTGRPPMIVAHSMGGLAVRAWLRWRRARDAEQTASTPSASPSAWPCTHVVTLGTPHRGTWTAQFGQAPNTQQMRPNSPWLQALAESETCDTGQRFTCVYSHCDNITMPTMNALLPGAQGVHIGATAHLALAYHPRTWTLVNEMRLVLMH